MSTPRNPNAKRSPSILVTDVRNDSVRRSSAPFAGAAYSTRQRGAPHIARQPSRFSGVSVSNILANASEIPSALRRSPRDQRLPLYNPQAHERAAGAAPPRGPSKGQARSGPIPKMIQPLPPRTLKTSQKLVYIPDEDTGSNDLHRATQEIQKARPKEDLLRVTAYLVAEAVNLDVASAFLRKNHMVSARLYDEVLYVPYQLPLLPGKNGNRVRSNLYSKDAGGRAKVDVYLDRTEQKDYHFEYYSGQETEGPSESAENEPQDNYASDFKTSEEDSFDPHEPQYFNYGEPTVEATAITTATHAEVFIFNYGVIVFWNFTKNQEEDVLADFEFATGPNGQNPILIGDVLEHDYEMEEFRFEYDKSAKVPRIYNDLITLRSEDHLIKMTVSHAVAQSTKLSRFESRMSEVLYLIQKLPRLLALTGQLGLSREQLLRKSGKLFKLRVDVNLSSNVLDVPEFFWSFEPSLNPLYTAARDYLEIDERVRVLNERCKVFLEFTDVIADSIAEKNMNKITWVIIIIIVISLMVSCLEIFVRYLILRRNKGT